MGGENPCTEKINEILRQEEVDYLRKSEDVAWAVAKIGANKSEA